MRKFLKTNKLISAIFILALIIVVSYVLSMDCPEWFPGAGDWFNIIFQLAIGFIINFMFYTTQVYIPKTQRELAVNKLISQRITRIISEMNNSLSSLAEIYLNRPHNKNDGIYTKQELDELLKLDCKELVHVANSAKTTPNNIVYFTVQEWLKNCIVSTNIAIDELLKYYGTEISGELAITIEKIPRCFYHKGVYMLLSSPRGCNFSNLINNNFFEEYYNLISELKLIQQKDYV